ncbi:hypothetical protein OPT61_g6882 [Boeremia exigua]|uniref:Uncharacterized protein n=1 Tax=Boeremia exigua TaxID=749465 RepID=A0ACC2I4J3_9PLEO|nr:hypothetical protein OPT61_g6882 [Boeremia exigua]
MQSIPIKRQFHTTDQTAPWDGVVFTYEVGSDELGEALKVCYPTHRTLRQRKHAAIIQFLEQELLEMQSNDTTMHAPRTPPMHNVQHSNSEFGDAQVNPQSPAQSQSTLSDAHSPAKSNNLSMPCGKRHQVGAPTMQAIQPTYIDPTTAANATHLVFNAFDGRTMQQKTKRKMTAEERLEYKETRKRGACFRCKRQKGKCTHMEVAASSPSTISDQINRRALLDSELLDTKHSDTVTLQHTPAEHGHHPANLQHVDFQQQPAHMTRRSSNVSMRSLSGSASPRWPNTVSEESQIDTPGYVQQSHLSEAAQNLIINGHYNPDHMPTADSFQHGGNYGNSPDETLHSGIPPIYVQGPDQPAYFIPEESLFDTWDFGQYPDPDNTGWT